MYNDWRISYRNRDAECPAEGRFAQPSLPSFSKFAAMKERASVSKRIAVTLLVVALPGFAAAEPLRPAADTAPARGPLSTAAQPTGARQGGATPAQDPAEQRREELITVSATRLPVRLSDLPVAATTWEARDLQQAPAIVIDQALRSSPAVSLFRRTSSRDSHPTAQGLNLRGIAPSGVSRALVLIDGVPMNDPFGGWVYWDRVPLLAVEQVEVALGGGSAPYGNQALGGVMQFVTRRQTDTNMQMQILAGNESTVRFGISAGSVFDGGSVFASAQAFNTAGYIQTAPEDRGSVDEPISSNNQTARLRADFGGVTINVDGLREVRGNGTDLQKNDTSFGGISAAWNGVTTAGNGGWNAYGLARTQVFDSSFSAVAADRDSERLVLLQRVPSTDFGAGGYGWSSFGGANGKISYGGDWRRVQGHSKEFVVFNSSTRTPGGVQNSGGGFAAVDWQASSDVTVSAGLRADAWHNEPRDASGEPRSADALSPRAGVAWRLDNGLTLRGAGYGAFRAPTLNELYRQFRVGNVLTSPNSDLVAERLWGGEFGGGWSGPLGASSATLNIDGTFYWNSLDDAIINATVSVSPTFIRRVRDNLGAATARGVELNGSVDFADNWTISAAYAWLDSFIREAIPGADPAATVGNRLPQVPTYRTRATVLYRADPGWAGSLSVGAIGEQFEDDLNLLPLAAAVLVDASIEIPIIDAAHFTVRVENLFNEAMEIKRAPVLAYGAPRLVYAGFTLTFPD